MDFDNTTGILTLDEYELHSIIVGLKYLFDETGVVDYIEIVPKDPDKFNKKLVDRWERRMEQLILKMGQLDAQFHKDAEYTC